LMLATGVKIDTRILSSHNLEVIRYFSCHSRFFPLFSRTHSWIQSRCQAPAGGCRCGLPGQPRSGSASWHCLER
jgi:hypothetical protein